MPYIHDFDPQPPHYFNSDRLVDFTTYLVTLFAVGYFGWHLISWAQRGFAVVGG